MPVQRLKGDNPTTRLPSGRLATRPRELNITFKPKCKDSKKANLATNYSKKNGSTKMENPKYTQICNHYGKLKYSEGNTFEYRPESFASWISGIRAFCNSVPHCFATRSGFSSFHLLTYTLIINIFLFHANVRSWEVSLTLILLMWRIGWAHNNARK